MAGKTLSTRNIARRISILKNQPLGQVDSVTIGPGGVVWHSLRILIPPGHEGLTKVQFVYAGQSIVPWGGVPTSNPATADPFLYGIPGDYTFLVDLEIDGPITVNASNSDIYEHSFYCLFNVEDVGDTPPVGITNIVPL